jgi:hypothetical protein
VREVLLAYLAGVLIGSWRGDGPVLHRLGLALLWPVALVACVVTLSVLGIAAVVLFPVVGLVALGAVAGGWWLFGT